MGPGYLALAWLLACTSAPDPVDRDETGWVGDVAFEPHRFAAAVEPQREAWIALHAHEFARAWEIAPEGSAVKRRAARELAVLHADLARLTALTWWGLHRAYSQRHGLPDEARPLFEAAARCDLTDATPRPSEPILEVEVDGYRRRWFDPCLQASMAALWAERAWGDDWRQFDAGQGLEATLFAPWLTRTDLDRDRSSSHPGLLGQSTLASLQSDDPGVDGARSEARALKQALTTWSASLTAHGDPEGLAVLTELGLLPRFQQEWLIVQARSDLLEERPLRALATLELARDVTHRTVGPRNAPALFSLLAEANLASGRAREALDALEKLSTAVPSTHGLQETLGDLSVLQGLDRHGDSKEN